MTVSIATILQNKGLFDFDAPYNQTFQKKPKLYDFDVDPIAVACYLERSNNSVEWESMTTRSIQSNVTLGDLKLAAEIRDHYSKRIMLWKLLGDPISKFRESLNTFIHQENMLVVDDEYLGLIRKLPRFYHYDLDFDKMRYGAVDAVWTGHTFKTSIVLTPIVRLEQKTRLDKTFEYWLKDENERRFMIPVAGNNPLDHLYKSVFDKKTPLMYTAQAGVKSRNNLKYYILARWEVEQK